MRRIGAVSTVAVATTLLTRGAPWQHAQAVDTSCWFVLPIRWERKFSAAGFTKVGLLGTAFVAAEGGAVPMFDSPARRLVFA